MTWLHPVLTVMLQKRLFLHRLLLLQNFFHHLQPLLLQIKPLPPTLVLPPPCCQAPLSLPATTIITISTTMRLLVQRSIMLTASVGSTWGTLGPHTINTVLLLCWQIASQVNRIFLFIQVVPSASISKSHS